jgi:glycerophosphoryl diester phosphodiesterase
MRKQDASIRLSALVGAGESDAMMGFTDKNKDFVHIHDITGAEIVSPDYNLVTAQQVAAAHNVHMQVVPWTVNSPQEWQRLVDAKVDAIISDDPAALLAWLKEQNPPLH